MLKVNSVDEYIASAPEELQPRLRQIRQAFRECVPEAEERISYGMPFYAYHGRLGYFAYAKYHIGLYAMFPDEETLQTDLKDYSTAKGTIRFPSDKPLPIALIKKLIKDRARGNESSQKS